MRLTSPTTPGTACSPAHKSISQIFNLSRQRNQTILFVSQEARQVDRNIASAASVVVFKELGMLQPELDRPQLRKLVVQAREALARLGRNSRRWAYVYSPDADVQGLLECQLPCFWKPSLSRLFANEAGPAPRRPGQKLKTEEKAVVALELRQQGLSYRQIARQLGVSKATIVNYLKGYPYRS
jgi:DNA-binding NarL/FixJ family response regulator